MDSPKGVGGAVKMQMKMWVRRAKLLLSWWVGGFKAAQQELRPPGVGLVFVCRVVRKMKSHNGVETPKFPS